MRKTPGRLSPGAFMSVRLERVGDKSANDAAGKRHEDRIIPRPHPVVAVRRRTQVVVIGVRNDHVVRRIAAIEPVTAVPAMLLEAVLGGEAVPSDEPVRDDPAVLDLLVAAAVVVTAEIGGGGRGGRKAGDRNRSAGKCESNLFHLFLHSIQNAGLALMENWAFAVAQLSPQGRKV